MNRPLLVPRARSFAAFVVVFVSTFALSSAHGVAHLGGAAPADCAAAATTGATTVRVGVVIDYGILAAEQGAPAAATASCATVAEGANGFQILDATGHSYTVDGSGLVCSLDGYPNNGECGERTAAGYRYWAYFHGAAGAWTYSGQGPGSLKVHAPEVEGWHFVEGNGNKTDPVPSGPSDPNQTCPTTPTTVAPAQPPPTPPATAPNGNGNTGGDNPNRGPTSGAPGGGARGGANDAPTTSATGGPSTATDPSQPGAGAPGANPEGTTDGVDPSTNAKGTIAGGGAPTEANGQGSGAVRAGDGATDAEGATEAALDVAATRSTSSGFPIGALMMIVLIVGLAGAATMRFRAGAGAENPS